MRAVILAAGEGKRMRPLTASRPKVMLPVAGRPLLDYLVWSLGEAEIREVVIVGGYREQAISGYFSKHRPSDVALQYVTDRYFNRGNAYSLSLTENCVQGRFLLLNGDNFLAADDLRRLTQWPEEIALGGFDAKSDRCRKMRLDPKEYGYLVVEREPPRVTRIVEKPEDPPSRWIFTGACHFPDTAVYDTIRNTREDPATREHNLPDVLNALLESRGPARLVPLEGWEDLGRPWHLLHANAYVMREMPWRGAGEQLGTIMPGATIDETGGPVHIGADTTVRSGAYIEGPVYIGPECTIGPNCYIRPCTVLLRKNRIGNGAEVKNSIIMECSNVPHPIYVGDSVIGADCNLGGGTMVGNLRLRGGTVEVRTLEGLPVDTGLEKLGVIMGDGVKVGMNCSIDPGTIIGEKSLIGPGKFVHGTFPPNSSVY